MHPGVLSRRPLRARGLLWIVPAAFLGLVSAASGQTPSSLNLLQPLAEDRAKVDIFSGTDRQFVRGRLLEVTPSMLILEGKKGRAEVAAAEVREVWSPGGARFRKPLIVGTSIGLGLALLAKAGEGDCRDPTSLCATDGPFTASDFATVTVLGTATGLGWAWWHRQPRHLLYLSRDAMAEMAAGTNLSVPAPDAVRPDWQALAGIQGSTVELSARGSATTLKGPLLSVTPQAIQLLVEGEPYVIRQPDVRKVWREPRIPWWRLAVGSAYYGLVWGSIISVAACGSDTDTDELSTCSGRAFGITTGVFAGIIGFGVSRQRHDALAYDASRPVPAKTSALTLQPLLGRHAVGVRGAFTF